MSFFKPQISFTLNFPSPFSVTTHNSSEIFLLKHYIVWKKRANQKQFFRILSVLMKVHPIPQALKSLFKFNITVQCHERSCPSVFFWLKAYILSTKIAHQKEIFGLLSGLMKIQQIPHVIFETTIQFFFKICITLQYHER